MARAPPAVQFGPSTLDRPPSRTVRIAICAGHQNLARSVASDLGIERKDRYEASASAFAS